MSQSKSHRSSHKVIVHSRDSSTDSSTSSSTRSSGDYNSTASSRTSMAKGFEPVDGYQYRRVPDNDNKYITSKAHSTSRRVVEVHDHQKARFIADEPRASKATYEDYKDTQDYKDAHRRKSHN